MSYPPGVTTRDIDRAWAIGHEPDEELEPEPNWLADLARFVDLCCAEAWHQATAWPMDSEYLRRQWHERRYFHG